MINIGKIYYPKRTLGYLGVEYDSSIPIKKHSLLLVIWKEENNEYDVFEAIELSSIQIVTCAFKKHKIQKYLKKHEH